MSKLREAAAAALAPYSLSDYDFGKYMEDLCAALAEPTCKEHLQVEPVAKVELMTTGGNAGLATRIVEIDDHLRERLRPGQMLYTHPAPQRQPLSDEEIDRVTDAQWAANNHKPVYAAHRAFARAIERAHGIGGQDEQV